MKRSGDSLTNALTGGFKPFLLVCTVCAFALDLTVCICAAVLGIGPGLLSVLFLLLAVDVLFLLAVVFSNFRFAYTIGEIVLYTAATGLLTGLAGAAALPDDGLAFLTTAAGVSWLVVHILTVVAAVATWLHASRCIRPKRMLQTVIAAAFTVGMLAASVYYVCFIGVKGITGQGAGMRPVLFRYNEATQTYTAASVYPGRGRKVVVPAVFNGRPVSEVCGDVFTDPRITEIRLDCSPEVTFTEATAGGYTDVTADITADKSAVDALREKLFRVGAESGKRALFSAANRLRPTGLASGEAYVTFAYTPEDYRLAGGQPLATWFGQKGSVLSLDGLTDADYLTRRDNTSPEDLYWHYTHSGYILAAPQADGRLLEGAPVDDSYTAVPVTFDRVAAVRLTADNDDKYEIDDAYRYTELPDRTLDYRLTAVSRADELLTAVPRREGFDLRFEAETSGGRLPITSLSALLRNLSDTVACKATVNPVWSLNAPVVTVSPDRVGAAVRYGDSLTLTAEATKPTADTRLAYTWQRAGVTLGRDRVYTEDSMPFVSDTYRVSVTAKADCTSLTSEATAEIYVAVNPRPLPVAWTADANTVYTGRDKNVACAFTPDARILDGDDVILEVQCGPVIAAGTYRAVGLLVGNDARKYVLSEPAFNYTVTPAPLRLTWSRTALTYNGRDQCPAAAATGVGDDRLSVTVTGGRTNAGTYTATATIDGALAANYAVENAAETFTISPYALTVTWNRTALPYCGLAQKPTAAATGPDGQPMSLTVADSYTDAGVYTVTTAAPNANYRLATGGSSRFEITPLPVTLTWSNNALTYNGQAQQQRVVGIQGCVAKDRAALLAAVTYAGDTQAKNAGSYTVTAAIANGNYTFGNTDKPFTIARKAATATVEPVESVYGTEPTFSARFAGLVAGDPQPQVAYTVDCARDAQGHIPVGTYTVTAVVTDPTGNYEWTVVSGRLTVTAEVQA